MSATPAFQPPRSIHGPQGVDSFYAMHAPSVVIPLLASVILFGWRGIATIATVVLAAMLAGALLSRIGWRGRQLILSHLAWSAVLLGMLLPAQLFNFSLFDNDAPSTWPLVPAAGLLLALLSWVLASVGSGRTHPVLVAYLLLFIFFQSYLIPDRVLLPTHIITGDLSRVDALDASADRQTPWTSRGSSVTAGAQAIRDASPATVTLGRYTSGGQTPDRNSVSVEMMLRDQMPPLEDFIVAGQPADAGLGSALAIVIGGLLLLYKGLIDFRIPLLGIFCAFLSLLIFPVPVVITHAGPQWHWLAFRAPELGPAVALTLANYEILASPLLFVAFFLATSPMCRPIGRRARAVYASLFGLLCGPAQLYGPVNIAPVVALLAVALVSAPLDRWLKTRTLV